MKHILSEDADKLMRTLEEQLSNMFDDTNIDVHCIRANNTNKMEKNLLSTYIKFPIMTITCTREGSNIEIAQTCPEEIIELLPDVIGHLLGLVPKNLRNDIIASAIQVDIPDEGTLFDKDDE